MSKLSPALTLLSVALIAVAFAVGIAGATATTDDTIVTSGSNPAPFSQNKQNEPAVAVNPFVPSIAAAGANEEMDDEACNNRSDTTCPFTTGVGTSGIYFSDTGGNSWTQPMYTGWTARNCLGVPGTQPANPLDNCDAHVGPIGTLPRYYESGLVSDGDPAVGFGPQRARQITRQDAITGRERENVLRDVVQLAHVARPGVAHQDALYVGAGLG